MKSLDVSEENFETQRKVVQEEYRMRVSNAAYAPSEIRLEELVYQGYWPYEHDTIGSMKDLEAASLADVKQRFNDHYGAANTTLVLAGDITPAVAREKVENYFGDIGAGPPVPLHHPGIVSGATSPRRGRAVGRWSPGAGP